MKTIVLIADSSAKRQQESPACDLFTAPMFCASLKYARSLNPDEIFVLSVKYGLVGLNDRLAPYETSSITRDVAGADLWATRVLTKLRKKADLKVDKIVFLAGRRYRDELLPHIKNHQSPMEGMSTARQLNFLREQVRKNKTIVENQANTHR